MKNKNLIGISGKMGVGKDTVGKIIQFLTCKLKNSESFEEWYENGFQASNWEIKKFANKLKDIVCLLIGCTREQLEDADFKNTELGEEWWYIKQWYPANKDYKKVFTLYPYIGFDSRVFDGNDCCMWQTIKTTPRLLLQLLGTECGRQIIHPNVWVNATMANYKSKFIEDDGFVHTKLSDGGLVKWKDNPIWEPTHYPNWIITDVRFPNEAKAITDKGGINIRLQRNSFKWIDTDALAMETGKDIPHVKEHESETALDLYKFDYVINNNGTIEELIEKVKEILIKENII